MKTLPRVPEGILLKVPAGIFLHALVLFGGAGTLIWREAWLYLASHTLAGISIAIWLRKNNADLLRERLNFWKPAEDPKDKAILFLGVPLYFIFLLTPGIDAVRWQYSDVPEPVRAIAFGVLVISYMISFRVIKENAFLTRTIEIQHERGHRVVTTGPYSIVRHPLYSTGLLFLVSLSITLGSWLALIPAAGLAILLVVRIHIEEKILCEGLKGYEEYMKVVRFRLLPGVW